MVVPPKDPYQMTDEEMLSWVLDLIDRKAPEGENLDYKRTLSIELPPTDGKGKKSKNPRVELAKDVSSFANTYGGFVIYGVDEEEGEKGIPYPKPLGEDGGMVLPVGFRESVNNILLDSIDPPLPELVLRALQLPDHDRQLFVAYHPASYDRPHMVVGYGDGRYYKRGAFRAVQMSERDVDQAYAARRAMLTGTRDFLASARFGPTPDEAYVRIIVMPHLSTARRDTMRSPAFRQWILRRDVAGRDGEWTPTLDGWRFLAHAHGPVEGRQYDVRVFHSGAVCMTSEGDDIIRRLQGKVASIHLPLVEALARKYVVDVAADIALKLSLVGPVAVHCELRGFEGVGVRAEAGWTHEGERLLLPNELTFDVESSMTELVNHRDILTRRIADHVAAAGGLWAKGDEPEPPR